MAQEKVFEGFQDIARPFKGVKGKDATEALFKEVQTGVRATLNMAVLKARLAEMPSGTVAATLLAALAEDMATIAANFGMDPDAFADQVRKQYLRVLTEVSEADGSA